MRHAFVAAAFTAIVLLAAAVAGALAGHGTAPVHAWVVTRGPEGAAMVGVLAATDGLLLNTWWHGRLLLLQVRADARLPRGSVWLALKMPPKAAALAGCG